MLFLVVLFAGTGASPLSPRRVDQMMADGLLDEVESLLPYRHLSTLRTVGYRELFPVLDGTKNLADAVAEIKLNTWHYARKQLTWCRRYL